MHLDLLGIFVAGLLTFASPCVLPLVPVYLSVLAGASVDDLKAGVRTARAVRAALAFALGLTLVFVGLGLAASSIGSALLAHRTLLLQVGGLLVLLFGLKALGVLRVPWLERDVRPMLSRHRGGASLVSAFVFGAAFALGWTPCIGPVLGSVLTYAASQSTSSLAGAGYLGAYAAGLSLPLLGVAALAPLALRWHRRLLPHLRKLEVATGVLLIGVGLLLNTDSLDLVIPMTGSTEPVARAWSSLSVELARCASAWCPCFRQQNGTVLARASRSSVWTSAAKAVSQRRVAYVFAGCPRSSFSMAKVSRWHGSLASSGCRLSSRAWWC
jgi:cytochrome c-type biogenesis protein